MPPEDHLLTEARNPQSEEIDRLDAGGIVALMNAEDAKVVAAVGAESAEIAPLVGPEVVAGSTRLKAGTATKMILNMVTTGAMVLIGKTYGNRMIDLQPTNEKLRLRSRRILRELAGIDDDRAAELLRRASGHLKRALVMAMAGVGPDEAQALLDANGGQVRAAVMAVTGKDPR